MALQSVIIVRIQCEQKHASKWAFAISRLGLLLSLFISCFGSSLPFQVFFQPFLNLSTAVPYRCFFVTEGLHYHRRVQYYFKTTQHMQNSICFRMFQKLITNPSSLLAPFYKAAMSTISTVASTTRSGLTKPSKVAILDLAH